MKMLIKMIVGFVLLTALLLGGLVLGKNAIAKAAIEKGTEAVTGLQLKMGTFDFSLSKSYLNIEALQLFNPQSFQDRIMVDLPRILVDYHFWDLLKKKIHVEKIELHLKEFVVVRSADGRLNLDALKPAQKAAIKEPVPPQEPAKEPGDEKAPKPVKRAGLPPMIIDEVHLKIEKVIFKDYSLKKEGMTQVFNVNIDETHKNITDPNKLVQLIVFKALKNTTIGSLVNFDMAALQGTLENALGGLEGQAGAVLKQADQLAGNLQNTAKDMAGQVTGGTVTDLAGTAKDTAKETAAEVKAAANKLKGLFKSSE